MSLTTSAPATTDSGTPFSAAEVSEFKVWDVAVWLVQPVNAKIPMQRMAKRARKVAFFMIDFLSESRILKMRIVSPPSINSVP